MAVSADLGDQSEVRLPQGIIRYRERGQGSPIVFVHGLLTNGDLWRKVVPLLAREHRCITPDWPLGSHEIPLQPTADLSTPGLAALVAAFITEVGLRDVTLVGNDTGGAVCQLVVTRHADRIARLVLTSCDAFETFPPSPFGFLRWLPLIPGAVWLVAQSLRLSFVQRLPIGYGLLVRDKLDAAIARSFVRPAALSRDVRRDLAKVLRGVSTRYTLDAARRFSAFDRPVLLAWAGDDRLFPLDLARRLAAAFPRARLEIIPDCRTFVPEDQPERLATLIRSFSAGVTALVSA
jgi:pimeloyl-ACP methyl ester carboxylesterase